MEVQILGIDSRWWYVGLIGLVVLERLVELLLTRRNARRLAQRGGIQVGSAHYPWMVALHSSLLIAAPAEVLLLHRPLVPALAFSMLALVGLTMGLRYWAISSLGDRWTTEIWVVPGEQAIVRGPYRYLRHPNYLAVVIEVAALPLVHTAWISAVFFSLGNVWVLKQRIRAEEAALSEHSAYGDRFAGRRRFLPGGGN